MSTKIHSLVDARGRPLGVHPTEGRRSELLGADALLPPVQAKIPIADTAFDVDSRVRHKLAKAGVEAVIPSRADRLTPKPLHRETYKLRDKIENLFAHLKQFRGLATRYEKTAICFLAVVQYCCALRWLV